MPTKKIVFVTDTMTSGGAERVISLLSNILCDNYSVEIVCLRKKLVHYVLNNKIRLTFAEDYTNNWVSRICWLRKYLSGDSVVIAFMVKVYCIVLISQLFTKTKIICSERNDPYKTNFFWKVLRGILIYRTNALVVQTNYIKNYFPTTIKRKTYVIYNPLSLEQCGNNLWNCSRRSVLAVGRIDRQKNYLLMLNAFIKFHRQFPSFVLNIWGNRGHDEQEEDIYRFIKDNKAENFIKINGCSDDVSKEYDKAYMFLMSSNYEGFSNSLMEAFCSGVPIVSTKVSGAIDIIKSGENGFLVNIGDEDSFYKAMKTLASDYMLAEKFSYEGIKSRGLFSINCISKEWESLINKI